MTTTSSTVGSTALDDSYPLSPVQQGMLFHSLVGSTGGVYNQQLNGRLRERVDEDAFRRAWQRVFDRHDALRTCFITHVAGEPRQRAVENVPVPLVEEDWRERPATDREAAVRERLTADRLRPFDMETAPLSRLLLLRLGDEDYQFSWTVNHAVIDARSRFLLMREFSVVYDALCAGKEPGIDEPRQYGEYIDWFGTQDFSSARDFWRRTLDGVTESTPLPEDRASFGLSTGEPLCEKVRSSLSADISRALEATAEAHEVTMNTLMQAAWGLILSRYSGHPDVVFGSVRAGRHAPLDGIETMIGPFINVVPVVSRTRPDARLSTWLHGLREQWVAMRECEHTPLPQVLEWADLAPGASLFDSLAIFHNADLGATLQKAGALWRNCEFEIIGKTNFALDVVGYAGPELTFEITYDAGRFTCAGARRRLAQIQTVLTAVATGSDPLVADLPLVDDGERKRLVVDHNSTSRDWTEELVVHRLVESQVARTPEAVAVVAGSEEISYSALNDRADRLAAVLRQRGVGPDRLVGLCMERSIDMIVGVLGILKAGGAYVPLDPDYPDERLAYMAADCELDLVATHAPLKERALGVAAAAGERRGDAVVATLDLDELDDSERADVDTDANAAPSGGNLVYVMYTSGSTGRPKGVMVCHRGVANYLLWRREAFPLATTDRVLQKTSISFVDSVWELFEPLMTGARLIMARPGGHRDPAYLVKTIAAEGITAIDFIPTMLRTFLAQPGVETCTTLRRVTTGSETVLDDLVRTFHATLDCELFNLYGPTEASIAVTCWPCRRDDGEERIPIGHAIANAQIYILDAAMRPVPTGAPGEIYIGGIGVARGYVNKPDVTEAAFVRNPFATDPDSRLYKTGDLGSYRDDGAIDFIGRIDNQEKIRGYRVEPGEIEAVLLARDGVREAVVITHEIAPGERALAAYVAGNGSPAPSVADLRRHAGERLPDYMVPSSITIVDALPRTPNGKVDRSGLPDPTPTRPDLDTGFHPPVTVTEEVLAVLWAEELGLDRVGADDDFFELGGHSLPAIRLMARISDVLAVELPLSVLFEAPSVRALSAVIDSGEAVRPGPVVTLQPGEDRPPVFFLHGLGGEVFNFYGLARTLGPEQPAYGLHMSRIDADADTDGLVERLAADYIKAVRKVQPSGPVRLLGYSFGATVAYEMACQLAAAGEEVALVGSLDHAPFNLPARRLAAVPRAIVQTLVNGAHWLAHLGQRDRSKLVEIWRRRWGEYRADASSDAAEKATVGDPSWPEDRRRLAEVLVAAAYKYAPPAYAGTVTLFRARQQPLLRFADPCKGWGRVASRVDIRVVPGHHYDMLDEPNVPALATAVREALRADR